MAPQRHKIEVIGLVKDPKFHQARVTAEGAHQKSPDEFLEPVCTGMIENDWLMFLEQIQQEFGGSMVSFPGTALVKVNDKVIGKTEDFVTYCSSQFGFKDFRPLALFDAMSRMAYEEHLINLKHDLVYMDITVGKDVIGCLLIELFNELVPKTCENFKQLCLGNQEESSKHDPPLQLAYKGSMFHRVVKNGWIQGGDIVHGSGNNGWSIHGETFEDENYSVLHSKRGILGMANKGRHSNSSQFYLTFQPAPWMDFQYVAFGQVIEGMDTLSKMESMETYNERPVAECFISDCGIADVKTL